MPWNVLPTLRRRWQRWTGEEETPFDGDFPAWLASLLLHLGLLVAVSLLTFAAPANFEVSLTANADPALSEPPDEFRFQEVVLPAVGAISVDGSAVATAAAPELADLSEIVQSPEIDPLEVGEVQFSEQLEIATAPLETSTKLVRGLAGVGVSGASGAIDRITHEIQLSLDERDTLVVWLFDQSGSLERQRGEIRDRISRIYEELGLMAGKYEAMGDRRQPLLTAVLAFGERATWMLGRPTADVEAIKRAVESIELDESGIENTFSSVYLAAERFRKLRSQRNIMLIAVTDEVGDDQNAVSERAVDLCRRCAIPVYVLGVPAAFGQAESLLKWVDPDPTYDQTPRWGRVNQGPESALPERLSLPFTGANDQSIDSGFGPFALTRLCFETGGGYFAIHPNRRVGRTISSGEIEPFASQITRFFDPQRMRMYRPDYVSIEQYLKNVKSSALRGAVVRAAASSVDRLRDPELVFVKRDEATFVATLTDAQKAAARLEPKLNAIYETLKAGEDDRQLESSLRWQAAYDLAMGQTLAVLVRTRAYNEMLAQAKRGMTPRKDDSNTWRLAPDDEISLGSRLEKMAERAREYLQRVVDQHDGTPWADVAERELATPLGWKWQESYTELARNDGDSQGSVNNAASDNQPRNEQRRMLPPPPPRRELPRL